MSRRYGPRYTAEVRCDKLGKYRCISGSNKQVVEQQARAQQQQWQEMLQKREAAQQSKQGKEDKKKHSQQRTDDAKAALQAINEVLINSLGIDSKINWNVTKERLLFSEPMPANSRLQATPPAPNLKDYHYERGLLDVLIWSRGDKKVQVAKDRFDVARREWEVQKEKIEKSNNDTLAAYNLSQQEWRGRKQRFEEEQVKIEQEKIRAVEALKEAYSRCDSDAVEEYCDMVLSQSRYPDYFPQQFELEYKPENKTLVIEYILPNLDTLPTLKEVTYIQSKDGFKEIFIIENELNKIYDKLLYDIALRTLHETFKADKATAIDAVAFNGWVHFVSPATGKEVNSCILSVHTTKAEFLGINLSKVDSKVCFKTLKGVGSSQLHSMTAIAPILNMDRTDKRFVASYAVEEKIEEATNLAAMEWQDFEQLVREILEKEFAAHGGEVRVTQVSHDGGVDAVIFDPDPIRGGKIVVQAKRYTNVVGVSAVRDLYGTVMNEGANKGILITTSDYGPEAYTFAKDKPLTLLNGGNLLHLLGRHGHKARIDLKEAKKKV